MLFISPRLLRKRNKNCFLWQQTRSSLAAFGIEPALPNVPRRTTTRIPVRRVTSMRLFERLRQRLRRVRHCHQVYVPSVPEVQALRNTTI